MPRWRDFGTFLSSLTKRVGVEEEGAMMRVKFHHLPVQSGSNK